jgi:hypothetical protein
MAFPGDWERKGKLTIQSAFVDALLTDYPTLHTSVPADFYTKVANGGGDVRYTSDEAGTTLLVCEVRVVDTGGSCEVFVKIPSVSAVADTDFWVWYGASGKSQPARDSAGDGDGFLGSENTWDSDFTAVISFKESDADGTPTHVDSTSNDNHATRDTGDYVDAHTQYDAPWDAASSTYGAATTNVVANAVLNFPNAVDLGAEDMTFSAWVNPNFAYNTSDFPGVMGSYNDPGTSGFGILYLTSSDKWVAAHMKTGGLGLAQSAQITSDEELGRGVWQHFVGKSDSGVVELWIDNPLAGTDTTSGTYSGGSTVGIGYSPAATTGKSQDPRTFDELRISSDVRSDAWDAADYESQSDPAAFLIASASQPTKSPWHYYAQQH